MTVMPKKLSRGDTACRVSRVLRCISRAVNIKLQFAVLVLAGWINGNSNLKWSRFNLSTPRPQCFFSGAAYRRVEFWRNVVSQFPRARSEVIRIIAAPSDRICFFASVDGHPKALLFDRCLQTPVVSRLG